MPRKRRQFKIGGVYHILNRGVEKRNIFRKKQDYSRFILALEFFNSENSVELWDLLLKGRTVPPKRDSAGSGGRTVPPERHVPPEGQDSQFIENLKEARSQDKKPIVELLAFALMPNHFHLLIREIRKNGISLFMRKMGGYSTYFNKQYDRVGPLFQGRYKSVYIKDDEQLNNIFAYIHTNPIGLIEPGWKDLQVRDENRALKFLENYEWTSYKDYIKKEIYHHAISGEFLKNHFGGYKGSRRNVEDWVKFKAENLDIFLE